MVKYVVIIDTLNYPLNSIRPTTSAHDFLVPFIGQLTQHESLEGDWKGVKGKWPLGQYYKEPESDEWIKYVISFAIKPSLIDWITWFNDSHAIAYQCTLEERSYDQTHWITI